MSYSRPTRRPLIASEAPLRPPLRHIIATSVAVSLSPTTLTLISTSVSDLLFLPPIGVAMAPVVGVPDLPLARPQNAVVGHLIGCTAGIVTLHMLGSTIIAAAVAAGAAFVFILLTRAIHSPTTVTAMVAVLMPHGHGLANDFRFTGFIFASPIMTMAFGILANRLYGLRYPTYWW